jgi:hypothetical protein
MMPPSMDVVVAHRLAGCRSFAAGRAARKAPLIAFIAGSRDATYEAFHEIRRLSGCRRRADGGSGPGWR